MPFTQEGLKLRERFLTAEFAEELRMTTDGIDPFTSGTADIPMAFRVGECRELAPDRTEFKVLVFWRNDQRTEQRVIKAELAKTGEKWLIDKIAN